MNEEKLVKENIQSPDQGERNCFNVNPLWPEKKKIKKTKFPGFTHIKLTEALNRRRRPGEVLSYRNSIRAHCSECMGNQPSLIEGCTAPECWLFPHRFNLTPQKALKQGRNVR